MTAVELEIFSAAIYISDFPETYWHLLHNEASLVSSAFPPLSSYQLLRLGYF